VGRSIDTLILTKVKKVFGRSAALVNVSCRIEAGRVTLIMGPNGAGKSTLLSILATLARPTSGEVRYGPHDHRFVSEQLRGRIGLLGHAPGLYRRMTCRENLLFFARMHGRPDPAALAQRWLERVGMAEAADRPVRELSRGMAQRVGLARALLHDPDLLLLDEPHTGLDAEASRLLGAELARTSAEGKIVVVVSHDARALDGLCGHLIVVRRGRVAVDAVEPALRAEAILERYHAAV
jgi:heme exporter protein A